MIGGNCARRVIACKEVMRKEIGELTSSPACNQRIPSELLTQLQEVGSRCWRWSFVQKARRLLRSLHERCAFYRVRSDLSGPSSSFSEGLVPLSKDHSRQQNLCVQSESTPPKRKACTKRRRYILQPTPEFGSSDYFNSSLGGSSPNHFTYILVNSPLARALSMAVSMAFMSSGLFLLTGKPKDSLLRTSGRW